MIGFRLCVSDKKGEDTSSHVSRREAQDFSVFCLWPSLTCGSGDRGGVHPVSVSSFAPDVRREVTWSPGAVIRLPPASVVPVGCSR